MTSAVFQANLNQDNNARELALKHQASIFSSLAHRLEIARENQNLQLLSLLEQERQQLAQNPPKSSGLLKGFWNWLMPPMEISIDLIPTSSGDFIWCGYDPRTSETRYGETEADMVDWLEEN
jgi:hypothetical protein